MAMMNFWVICAAISVHTLGGTAVSNPRERTVSTACLIQAELTRDFIRLIHDFNANNDWLSLQKVFNRTERTEPLLEVLEECIKNPLKHGLIEIKRGQNSGDLLRSKQLVQLDGNGNIKGLYLHDQGLTDADFSDLSNLPPKLQVLDLGGNELSTFNFKVIPKALTELHLNMNKFRTMTLRDISQGLEYLNLSENQLTQFNLLSKKDNLKQLSLQGNPLQVIFMDANAAGRIGAEGKRFKIQRGDTTLFVQT